MDSTARSVFNHTLKLGGILIIVWVPLFLNDFRVLERVKQLAKYSVTTIKFSLIWFGIAIFNIGMFPSRDSTFDSFMHNISAYSLGVVFAVLMAGARWYVPKFSKEFYTASWVFAGVMSTTLFFAALGYVNTVGLELTAFVIGFIWLFKFMQTVEKNAEELEPQSFPE